METNINGPQGCTGVQGLSGVTGTSGPSTSGYREYISRYNYCDEKPKHTFNKTIKDYEEPTFIQRLWKGVKRLF